MAEVMAETMREHLDAARVAAANDDLVHAAGGHRPPVANPEPKLPNRPTQLRGLGRPRSHLRRRRFCATRGRRGLEENRAQIDQLCALAIP